MGVIGSFEMVSPNVSAGCKGHCCARSPLHRVVSILLRESNAAQQHVGWSCNLGTWHVFTKRWGRRVGRAWEASPSCLLEFCI